MKVLFLTSGHHVPSTRFRILQYVPHLRRHGVTCVVAHSCPPKYEAYRWIGWRLSERVRWLKRRCDLVRCRFGRFDVAVVEREIMAGDSAFFEAALRPLVDRLILDVDDGIFLEHPGKLARLAELADTVVAGNPQIATYFAPLARLVVMIPTALDLDRYPYRRAGRNEPPVVGWTGTSSNLPYLAALSRPLAELGKRRSFALNVIGDHDRGLAGLREAGIPVRFQKWRVSTEVSDLQRFDVGLMPLPDEPWAQYKCGLKILQYMAVGAVAVASPVGVNTRIIDNRRNGLLASTDDDWVEALARLIDDDALRQRLAEAAARESNMTTRCRDMSLPGWMS